MNHPTDVLESNHTQPEEGDQSWDGPEASLQERLERSPAGRRLINGFIALTLALVLTWNLPMSEVRRLVLPVARPVLNATGLTQSWRMFAPDPPRQSTELVARILYSDGSLATWRPPEGGPVLAGYRTYHWRKWASAARTKGNRELWEPAARWIAANHDSAGRRTVRIDLVSRWRALLPPGTDTADAPWQQRTLYSLEIQGGAS